MYVERHSYLLEDAGGKLFRSQKRKGFSSQDYSEPAQIPCTGKLNIENASSHSGRRRFVYNKPE